MAEDSAADDNRLFILFQKVTTPSLRLEASSSSSSSSSSSLHETIANAEDGVKERKLLIPEEYVVNIGGAEAIYDLFKEGRGFASLSIPQQTEVLDTIYVLLRRSFYDVVRFRCHEKETERSIISLLLNTFERGNAFNNGSIFLSKRILRLIGILAFPAISSTELRRFLSLLWSSSSLLANSLLRAFRDMIRYDDSTAAKASPDSFFNFNGINSGLYARQAPYFFSHEFQICMWFRVEAFHETSAINGIDSLEPELLSCFNDEDKKFGFRVVIRQRKMVLEVLKGMDAKTHRMEVDHFQLRRGVWYHLVVAHTSKSRYSLYSQSKIAIRIDGTQYFEQSDSLPDIASGKHISDPGVDAHLILGRNFSGQMGAVYFFLDSSSSLPAEAIEVIQRLSAGKQSEGTTCVDLEPIVFPSADGKQVSMTPNTLAVYHPSRLVDGKTALDVHGGRHASLGEETYAWSIRSARDVLVSLGGVSCLLPLFPRLLIENSAAIEDSLEDSAPKLGEACNCISSEEGTIGLLLSIIANCVHQHPLYLQDLLSNHGIHMIEYAIQQVNPEMLRLESDTFVLTLLELRQAVKGIPSLEDAVMKHLQCNFTLWCKANPNLQRDIMRSAMSIISSQPQTFVKNIGIQWFLSQLRNFFPSSTETPATVKVKTLLSDS